MKRPRTTVVGLTALLLCLLLWLGLSPNSSPPEAILAVEHRPVIRPPASYARALPPLAVEEPEDAETDAPTQAAIEREAVDAVWPDSATVRCPASGLEPGLLTARPTPDSAGGTVKFATFDAGSVFAVVSGETTSATQPEVLCASDIMLSRPETAAWWTASPPLRNKSYDARRR